MNMKWYKKGLAIILIFALFLTPGISSYASWKDVTSTNPDPSTLSPLQLLFDKSSQSVWKLSTDMTPLDEPEKRKELSAKETAKEKSETLLDAYGVTSVQYALIDHGEITISGQSGYASKELKKAPTNQTMYGIGSISKIFTTAAVMQLVDQGKIDLDSPITTYIPEFKMADSRYKDITVRMLLNHSSGLLGSTLENSMLLGDNNHDAYDNFLNALSTQRLKADPGAFSVYCNDGFTLAELVVEHVSGISFTQYISDYISKPLGLQNTKTPLDTFNTKQLAGIYPILSSTALPYETFNMIGAGGLYSTAEDLCLFAQAFMTNSNDLISYSSKIAMENNEYAKGKWVSSSEVSGYGLGWDTVSTYPFQDYNIKALNKAGDIAYYHGNLLVLPYYNMAVAVLSSGGSSSYNQIVGQEILLAALKEKGLISEIKDYTTPEEPIKATMPEEYKSLSGTYANFMSYYNVNIDDGILTLTLPMYNNISQELIYTKDDCFVAPDGSIAIELKTELDGNTYLLTKSYATLEGIGETYSYAYEAQRILPKTLSNSVQKAWKARDNKAYVLVSERYSSYLYHSGIFGTAITVNTPIKGYVGAYEIMDENNLQSNLTIPMQYGRDLKDSTCFTKNGIEYIKIGESIYISTNGIKQLSTKDKFNVKIDSNGYAKYLEIPSTSSNKTVTITTPKDATFIVISGNGAVTTNYFINKKETIKLPKDGCLIFVGDANATFTVEYVK